MAQNSPSAIDVQEIQFKLHEKCTVFPAGNELRSHVNLLATASSHGLLFIANPNAPELKVIIIKDLVDAKTTGRQLAARQVPLPNVPSAIAASADGSMLAINYMINGCGFLQIYSVPSFITPQIKPLYNLRLSSEEHVTAIELLWNPVLINNLAVVLTNGALGMYTLKEGGNFEFHSLDKQLQVRCGCWSPKGKQIVLGFPNGKLQQYKPDLTPAKNIICPVGVHPGPFQTIAVHWLSTFQFAAVFLQCGPDMAPSLYIVNAPKGGQPSYINYYDICYSATGPRQHQMHFTHIQQWNLLLVTSANGVELGMLGTKEIGEAPTWVQYTLLDEARIEMPLTEQKDETYPIGFAFDTASSHQLIIGEQRLPVMPMVHVLSTHGHLVSFNFLNLTPGAVDVCSPPPPITDGSGQFRALQELVGLPKVETGNASSATEPTPAQSQDMSFAFNASAVTSTPAVKEIPKSVFGTTTTAPISSATSTAGNIFAQSATTTFSSATGGATFGGSFNLAPTTAAKQPQFGAAVAATPAANAFSGFGTATTFGGATEAKSLEAATSSAMQKPSDVNKPLYTVPPTFTAPASNQHQQQKSVPSQVSGRPQMSSNEIDDIVKQMIAVQVNSFDMELKQLAQQSKGLLANIGKPEEMKSCTKRLNDLHEIIEQANDRDFELDVQNLRHSLNESYAMLAECRTKIDMYNNPDITRLTSISTFDPINRRQLAKLQSYVASNRAHMQQLQQQIDAQWASYQDLVRRNSKTQMHIPCLDGIYQRLSKLKDLVARQRHKLNYIKSRLKEKGLIFKPFSELNSTITVVEKSENSNTMESLADSILSMSLAHVVDATRSKLSTDKLTAIREFLRDRQIARIKPQRPDRVGLKSEVILETKLQTERQSREGAVTRLSKMQQEKIAPQTNAAAAVITKPTATKPASSTLGQTKSNFAPPSGATQTATSTSFGIGGTSSFVKTAPVTAMKSDEALKSPFGNSIGSSSFASSFTGFGSSTASNQPLTFGQTKPVAATKADSSVDAFSVSSTMPQVPISFAAKVVSSEQSQPLFTSANSGLSFMAPKPLQANSKLIETEVPKTFSFGSSAQEGSTLFGGDAKTAFGAAPSSAAGNASSFGGTKPGAFEAKTGFTFGGVGASIGTAPSSVAATAATAATTTPSATPFNLNVGGSAASSAVGNSTTTTSAAMAAAKAPVFSGFGKSIGEATATTSSSTNSSNTAFAPATSSNLTTRVTSDAPGLSATATTTTSSDAADSLFGSLNICKPTTKETDSTKVSTAATVFGGFGGSSSFSFTAAGDTAKPLFGGTTSGSSFSFGGATTATKTAADVVVSTATKTSDALATTTMLTAPTSDTTTAASVQPPTAASFAATTYSFPLGGIGTTASSATPATVSTTTTAAATAVNAPTTTSSIFAAASSVSNAPSSIFAAAATSAPSNTAAINTSPSTSIFGGASFLSGTNSPPANTPSIFGTAAATVAPTTAVAPSIFGATATTSTAGSIFGAAAAATSPGSNVFGGIPKPDQSVFGSPPAVAQPSSTGGIFAAAAAANPSPFGSSAVPATAGGSIFGGGGASGGGFGNAAAVTSGGSIFGGSSPAAISPFGATGGSIFGGGAAKPAEGGNIFGSPTQPVAAAATGGGSIFGQSAFGQPAAAAQTGGSIFGAATVNAPQQPSAGFGGGSIFGGGTATGNTAAGGSIFGGGTAAPAFGASPTGFGSFSQTAAAPGFGSPNTSGSFAQGGASVAQSGFGSPQQSSAFAKPVFGGAPAFGSPPGFGAQPSFGGAPTFGSPKGFGSFGSPAAAAAPTAASGFGSPTQNNSLFEALGSTESGGLSFGNLAQNTNANAPKPTFGGTSFMNYRA